MQVIIASKVMLVSSSVTNPGNFYLTCTYTELNAYLANVTLKRSLKQTPLLSLDFSNLRRSCDD